MNILVTGASGFIGSHLCRALVGEGHHVRALLRRTSSDELVRDLPLEIHHGDLFDEPSLIAGADGVEIILHSAADVGGWRDQDAMIASHILGTENILRAAVETGVRRLVYVSSVAALGLPDHDPSDSVQSIPLMDETHAWNYNQAGWPYGYAKHEAEARVLHAVDDGLDAVIVNPSAVFGPGDKNLVSSALIWYMARGYRPPIPPGGLNVVHVDDVVAGILQAVRLGKPGERYILGGENMSIRSILMVVSDVIGRAPPRWTISRRTLRSLASAVDLLNKHARFPVRGHILRLAGYFFYYDTRKSIREFDLGSPRSFRSAAESAFHWYRSRVK